MISGSSTSYCQSGIWNPSFGTCNGNGFGNSQLGLGATSCSTPMVAPGGGQIIYSQGNTIGPFPDGSTANLNCNGGFPIG